MEGKEIIIGSCNLGQKYNGVEINRKESLKLIDRFYVLNGRIIDTAHNYKSEPIIAEWLKQNKGNDLKVITKIWKQEELFRSLETLGIDEVHCVLGRENNIDMREFLKDQQKQGIIEKWGMSLYLPQELDKSYLNVLQIPCHYNWFDDIDSVSLYAKVYIRSYYNVWVKKGYKEDAYLNNRLKVIMDNPNVNFVVGNDNIKQLEENMKLFPNKG